MSRRSREDRTLNGVRAPITASLLPAFRNAADSWLLHIRGHGRRRVQGQAAGLRLVAAARTAARPDGVAAVTHGERDQGAGREAGAAGRTDVDVEPGGARGDRLPGAPRGGHGELGRGPGPTTADP